MKDIADFENEIIGICSKYEKKIPHAALVGVLTVVAHIYMEAQINNVDFVDVKSSPKPAETKSKKK
jgi:hypothetical protein